MALTLSELSSALGTSLFCKRRSRAGRLRSEVQKEHFVFVFEFVLVCLGRRFFLLVLSSVTVSKSRGKLKCSLPNFV